MDQNFTLNELAEFAQQEKQMFEALNEEFHAKSQECYEPSAQALRNIMGYSQSLSVRDSELIEKIELNLN